jgi:hypothetical protein
MTRKQFRTAVFENNKNTNNGVPYCVICGKDKKYKITQLVADHINNISKDNRIENGQVLCRSHNKKKDPSRIITYLKNGRLTLPVYIHTRKERENLIIGSEAMNRNVVGKPKVMEWLKNKLLNVPAVVYDESFINSAAKIGGVNPGTAEIWIKPEFSPEGDYRIRTIERVAEGKKIKVQYIMTKENALEFDKDNASRSE